MQITIQSGNTLSGLAKQYGTTVPDILKANPSITNPNIIRAGAGLVIPDKTTNVPSAISAKEVKDSLSPNLSDIQGKPDTSSLDKILSSTAGLPTVYQQQYDDLLKQRQEMEKSLGVGKDESIFGKLKGLLGKAPDVDLQSKLDELQKKFQIPEWLQKVQTQSVKVAELKGQIDKMDIQQLNETTVLRNQLANVPTFIIDRQLNQTEREYAVKKSYLTADLGAESALLQAYAGNLGESRNLSEQAVNAYTFDITQKRKDFDSLFNFYGDWVQSLDKEQREVLQNAREELVKKEEETKKEKTDVMNLMIKFPNAGINISDTLQQAAEKGRKVAPTEKPDIFGSSEGGYFKQVFNTKTGQWEVQQVRAGTGTGGALGTGKYETELKNEIDKLYGGIYGSESAREKVIANLQAKFPGIDVAKDIYKRVPDNYEKNVNVPKVGNLSGEQMSIVNDAKARLDTAKQLEENYSAIRNQIIQKAKELYGFDLSLYI